MKQRYDNRRLHETNAARQRSAEPVRPGDDCIVLDARAPMEFVQQ